MGIEIIDADGHVTETWEQIAHHLEPRYQGRSLLTPFFPQDGWDRRLQGTKGDWAGDSRAWLEALDGGSMSMAVLYPTLGLFMPFLRDGITQAAIASFVKELGSMLDTTEGLSVEVACPKDIVDLLRERLAEAMAARGAPPGSVRCVPGDTADIRVTLNETVIETRLAEWLSRLEGVLR